MLEIETSNNLPLLFRREAVFRMCALNDIHLKTTPFDYSSVCNEKLILLALLEPSKRNRRRASPTTTASNGHEQFLPLSTNIDASTS
jgi:hypothetical protein